MFDGRGGGERSCMVLWESNEYFAMFLIKVLKPIVAVCNNETMIAFIICLMGTSGAKK